MADLAADQAQPREWLRAYEDLGPIWASGPGPAYERIAEVVVAVLPRPLRGAWVLDLGAGTGAASRCIARAGGIPVALDPALGMLAQARRDHRIIGAPLASVGGEAERLPLRDGSLDAVVACFSLSHVADPVAALREARRVLRPGGHLVAASFDLAAAPDPVKNTIDGVAQRFGLLPPPYYLALKQQEQEVGLAERLAAHATAAGLVAVRVDQVQVDSGLRTADDFLRYRLGTPVAAGFVASLTPARRAEFYAAALEALGPSPEPWLPAVLILSSRAAA